MLRVNEEDGSGVEEVIEDLVLVLFDAETVD